MSITLIHGDNTFASRQELNRLLDLVRNQNTELLVFTPQTLNPASLIQATQASSLFGQEKHIVIENLFSLKSKSDLTQILTLLAEKNTKLPPIIIWEAKVLTTNQINKLKPTTVKIHKTPTLLFSFLDQLYPGNTAQVLSTLKKIQDLVPTPLLIFMLFRHLRSLITVKDANFKGAPWQKQKLQAQAKKWPLPLLLQFHSSLLTIEYRSKTGDQFSSQRLEKLLIKTLSKNP
jgi:DNA polymerase III delta subunit